MTSQHPPWHQKYEYLVDVLSWGKADEEAGAWRTLLAARGEDGWELVHVEEWLPARRLCIFKRPVSP